MVEGAVFVATGPAADPDESGGLALAAVDRHGYGVALGASGLLHSAVYGTSGFKPCTVYGG